MNFKWLGGKIALGLLISIMAHPLIASAAARCAEDDAGQELCLATAALRIATLSPGATELTFAAGAGEQVIAGVNYSDYPPAALKLPLVGTHTRIDVEALLALKPDLIVTWVTGNPQAQMELLQELGIPMFAIEPRTFAGVSSAIERLAILAGTEQAGFAEAERFRVGIAAITEQYRNAKPISVFYQVWETPLMTINNEHLIGKVLQLCGGVNVFADMPRLVPRISPEVVLEADPEVILTGSPEGDSDQQLDHWQSYPKMRAVAQHNLFFVPASPISRPTPRLLEASRDICQKLDIARGR